MTDTQQLKKTLRGLMENFSRGDLSNLDQYFADDFSYRSTSGEEIHGIDEIEKFFSVYSNAFSNMEVIPEQIFVSGNKGVVVYRQKGTHTGEFQGIEPSNNDMDVMGCNIATFDDDGKIVDIYDVIDTLEVMRQLDALPAQLAEFTGEMSPTQRGA